MSDLLRRLRRAGVERIVIEREVPRDEIAGLVSALASLDRRLDAGKSASTRCPRSPTSRSAASR